MREEELFRVVNRQDEINKKRVREDFRQLIEDEFIINNVFLRYFDYLDKCTQKEQQHQRLSDIVKKSEAPVKKVKDFDISKHMEGSFMYLHKHTYLELDYVYRGSCRYTIENDNKVFCLKEKELCIINQNIIHGIETNDRDDIIFKCMIPFEYIMMEQYDEMNQELLLKRFFSHVLEENVTKATYLVYRITDTDFVEELIYRMFCEFLEKEEGWRHMVKNYLSSLFIYLMRIPEIELLQAKEIGEDCLNVTKVLNCIRKNYQYITLRDIAKDFHFHENYLSRMIKEKTNQNFRELLCGIRLKEAERLLLHTDLSVSEISLRIGYQKPNYFYKLFREHYSMTPMEYRMAEQSKLH